MKRQGIAIVTVLIIMMAMMLLMVGTSFTVMQENWLTRNDSTFAQAAYVAGAGVQRVKTQLFQTYRYMLNNVPTDLEASTRAGCSNLIGDGVDWNRNKKVDSSEGYPIRGTGTVSLGSSNGTYNYTITPNPNVPRFVVVSVRGNANGAQSQVQATFDLSNGGAWNYAIYSGRGASSKFLNGGATIRGGLYVEGDANNPSNKLIDTTGSFKMYNEYNLNNSDYNAARSRVVAGQLADNNLCATLRVNYGQIEVGGNSQFGTANNKLLGFKVGSNVSDTIGKDLSCGSGGAKVCADGDVAPFDLDRSRLAGFPDLDDQCKTNPNLTWRGCMQSDAASKGITITKNSDGSPRVDLPFGTLFNSPNCEADLKKLMASGRNASTTQLDFAGSNGFNCTFSYNGVLNAGGIKYVAGNPGRLEVYGTVNFKGWDLNFANSVNYFSYGFEQKGRNGSLFVEKATGVGGKVTMNGNFLAGDGMGVTEDQFPNQVMAIIAEGDVATGSSGSKNHVMGVVYSQSNFMNPGQSVFYGAVVSNTFTSTGNGNAGQNGEYIFVDVGRNRPAVLDMTVSANNPTFEILSYERR
jgi:hypothetical protein